MDAKELDKALLKTEVANGYCNGIIAREVKMMDQFNPQFWDMIETYKTPASICGYVATAIAPYVARNLKGEMNYKEVNAFLDKLYKDYSIVCPLIEDAITIIQAARQQYIKENKKDFREKKEEDNYLKDWVANYEISDTLQITSPDLENLFFLRYCGLDFPDLAAKAMHEEANRLKEEEPFKGQKMFIEVFYPERKLMSLTDFLNERRDLFIFEENKPMVFIADLMGHFVTIIALKIRNDKDHVQETVLLLDSTENKYLEHPKGSVSVEQVAKLAFPETYETFTKF